MRLSPLGSGAPSTQPSDVTWVTLQNSASSFRSTRDRFDANASSAPRRSLLIGLTAAHVRVRQLLGGRDVVALLEVLGALVGVDVVDDQLLEDQDGLAGAAGEILDVRIHERELRQLAAKVHGDGQAVAVPEVLVVADDAREGLQERRLQVNGVLAVRDVLEAEGLVDEREEVPHVVTEHRRLDALEDLRDPGLGERLGVALAGTEVAVEPPDDLVERDRREQVVATHVLLPADLVLEDELPIEGQVVHDLGTFDVLRKVAKDDVGVQAGLTHVEVLEALALPGLVRVEVDQRTEAGQGAVVGEPDGGRRPLQTVDDEDVIAEQELAVTELVDRLTAHAEVDVRDTTSGKRLLEHVDLAVGQSPPLVGGNLDVGKGHRIDHTPKGESLLAVDRHDVERTVNHLDGGHMCFLS